MACLIFLLLISCHKTNEFKAFIDEGLLESKDTNFETITNSSYYIEKYQLNADEINNIGCWYINNTIDKEYIENGGLGISVTFFPNRIFRAYKDHAELNNIQYVFGEWKIDNKKLLIKLKAKAIRSAQNDWEFQNLSNQVFYKVLSIEKYKIAVINSKPYDFSEIPQNIIVFFEINKKDLPRSRLLFDTLGDPPGDISINSKYGQILSSASFNAEYLTKMIEVW